MALRIGIAAWPSWLTSVAVLLLFSITQVDELQAQPANNDCLTAQPAIIPPSGNICLTASSVGATSSNTTNVCNATVVNEVWFSFIAAGPSNTVTVTPTGGSPILQPVITMSDAACGSATFNTCNAAATPGGTATVNWAYAAGTQVFVSVAGITGDGTFQICITSETPPPTPGSSCGGATPTCDSSPFTLASSAGNLSSGVSPSCFNILGTPQLVQNDMWFVFTVGQTGTFEFVADLNGVAEFDWAVFNITGGCPGVEVSCNYWFSGGNTGSLGLQAPAGGEFNNPITVTAGNTYAIMMDNYDNNGIGFDFTWGGTFQMAPTANFTVNTPTGCNTLNTTFTNTTVGASTYSWNFGNGSTSAVQNPPAQTYNAPGTYFVTLDATSGAGCTNSFTGSVEVFPDPTLSFSVTDESCAGACDGQLVASASGTGPFTYSWVGLPGNTATQANLCANTYDVTVTDQNNGCTASSTGTVGSGGATSDATITPAGPFCPADAPVNLVGADAGGTWSGTGITNPALGTFDPGTAGIGTWTITYTIAGACGDLQTTDIVVNALIDPTITPAGPFCLGDNPINLTAASAGGTWSGTGITNAALGTFDPSVAGIGNATVTYTIPGACGSNDSETIIVGPNLDATINPVGPFCSSEPAITMTATDGGGTWSGTGITNAALGTFDPSAAGLGTWTITYTISGACGDVQTTDIEVGEITFTQVVTDATCNGLDNGEILIQNPTGTAAHQFSIDGGGAFQATGLFSNLAAGNYSLVVEDANGCQSAPVAVIISEPSAVAAIASMDSQSSCGNPDGEASVVASGGTVAGSYQYSWNSPVPQFTNSATGLTPGTYTVTVTDDNSCTATADVTITATPGFTATISASNDATCFGTCDGDATVLADNSAIMPLTYSWNDSQSQTTVSANGLCAGNYTVTVTDDVGCLATAAITIAEPVEYTVQLTDSNPTVCISQSTDITATLYGGTAPFNDFTWSSIPLDPTLVPTNQNPTISPVVSTTYTLNATDGNGCSSAPVDITINVATPLALSVIQPALIDTGICFGDAATINLSATGGDGNYNYYVQPDLANPISLPFTTTPVITNTYTFVVTDGCNTPNANTASTITVSPLPQVDFVANEPSGCIPHSVTFTDLTSPAPSSWNWDFGDPDSGNNTSTQQNASHMYADAGIYDVSLSVTSAEGCVADLTFSNYIETFSPPYADFEMDTTRTSILNPTITFTDLSAGTIDIWDWDFGDGNFSDIQHPTNTYLDTGNHVITLIITSDDGCQSISRHNVYLDPIQTFYVPTAFTPDKDHINDGFRAYGEGYDWSNYQMSVFNRWGEEIFKTTSIEEVWRGDYKSRKVEAGIYSWRALISDYNGRVFPYNGHVLLLR